MIENCTLSCSLCLHGFMEYGIPGRLQLRLVLLRSVSTVHQSAYMHPQAGNGFQFYFPLHLFSVALTNCFTMHPANVAMCSDRVLVDSTRNAKTNDPSSTPTARNRATPIVA